MSAVDTESGFSVGYFPSIFDVVRNNLTESLSWASTESLYLAEQFLERLPGFRGVDLQNQAALGTVQLDIEEAIPDAMDKPLKAIFAELEAKAVQAMRDANDWLVQLKTYLPALQQRLGEREARADYDYAYQQYRTLVHQEAFSLLQRSDLLDIPGYCNADPHAVTMLVEFWEAATRKNAVDYDLLIAD